MIDFIELFNNLSEISENKANYITTEMTSVKILVINIIGKDNIYYNIIDKDIISENNLKFLYIKNQLSDKFILVPFNELKSYKITKKNIILNNLKISRN